MRRWALLLTLCAGCAPVITGAVQLDGKPFPIAGCRSGQASGFVGIDLLGADGRRLRMVWDPTEQASLYLMPPQGTGVEIGMCGPLRLEQQVSRINMIYNMMGDAQLSCSSSEHSVSGQISFENCH